MNKHENVIYTKLYKLSNNNFYLIDIKDFPNYFISIVTVRIKTLLIIKPAR